MAAIQSSASLLVYPVVFLVIAFLLLDILPQSIVRPYMSGQTMHEGAVLFAYILGAALFGWYGLFLGPFLLVLVVQFANVVLSDLVHGISFSPAPTGTTTLGTDPADAKVDTSNGTVRSDVDSLDKEDDTDTDANNSQAKE